MAQARLFQALSDPTRLKIIGLLAEGPLNVTGIVNSVRAAQPAVSRHLRILREVGLIHDKRLGKEVEYSLDAARVREACGWLGELAGRGGSDAGRTEARGGSDPGVRVKTRAAQPHGGRSQVDPRQATGKRGLRQRSGGRMKARPMRVSPLAARGGLAGVSGRAAGITAGNEHAQKEAAGKEDGPAGDSTAAAGPPAPAMQEGTPPRRRAGKVKGAGIRASGGKRPKRPARKPRPSRAGGEQSAEREPDGEPAYVVEREEDAMDDFLL